MSTATTTDAAILEELLATELFGWLNKITDEQIGWAKVRLAKGIAGSDRVGKGKVIGSLTRLEQVLHVSDYKIEEEIDNLAKSEIEALEGMRESFDEERVKESLLKVAELERLKNKRLLLKSLAKHLIDDRFRKQMEDKEICMMWIDENFDMRASTHEEEHPGRPTRSARVMVVGGFGNLLDILDDHH